mgnify:CR=1 FL=1
MSGSVTFNNITQVILSALDTMYLACMGFAFLIILLSIYRNYTQFGEYFGLKYMVAVLLTIVFIIVFPKTADYLFKAMLEWSRDAGKRVEEIIKILLSIQANGGFLDAVVTGIANLFYNCAVWLGSFIRDIMVLVLCGIFLIMKTLSPVFIAFLTVPETKSIAVNFLTMAFGLIMMPLCMLFGDLCLVWVICQVWEHFGLASAAAAGIGTAGGAGGALAVLAANPPGMIIVAAGVVGALFAFGCVFTLLCIIMYVGIPWACLSLFRGAGIGNALVMSLNTAANIMQLGKAGHGAEKSLGAHLSSCKRKSSNKPQDDGGRE